MALWQWLRAEWDRVLGFSLIGLGALFLVAGYAGISDSAYVAQALSYMMSGGIGGLFLLGVGATLLITADLHDEWRKIDAVEQAIRAGDVPAPAALPRLETVERNGTMVKRAAS
jgi:hypothetical protein